MIVIQGPFLLIFLRFPPKFFPCTVRCFCPFHQREGKSRDFLDKALLSCYTLIVAAIAANLVLHNRQGLKSKRRCFYNGKTERKL